MVALWSYGIALPRSCGRLTVATFLAVLWRHKMDAVEQRLNAWCCEVQPNAGGTRQPLDVTTCFVPLLRWVVALWRGHTHEAITYCMTMGRRSLPEVIRGMACRIFTPAQGDAHDDMDTQCGLHVHRLLFFRR